MKRNQHVNEDGTRTGDGRNSAQRSDAISDRKRGNNNLCKMSFLLE